MDALSVLHLSLAVLPKRVAAPLHHERWTFHLVNLHQLLARVRDVVLLGLPVFEPDMEVAHLLILLDYILNCVDLDLRALRDLLFR